MTEVALAKIDEGLSCDYKVGTSTTAAVVIFNAGDVRDSNDKKGCVWPVFKEQQPVRGAYASAAIVHYLYGCYTDGWIRIRRVLTRNWVKN